MYVKQRGAQKDGEPSVRLMDDVKRLVQLEQYLPAHIFGTVLPLVEEEIASSAVELNAQVDGTRQLLLQSAALRRSTVLAPLLKQLLVTRAIQLQRRRAQLVQQLQRQIRHWRSNPPGAGAIIASSGGGSYRRGGPLSGSAAAALAHAGEGALRETWATLREAFRFEEARAHLVQAPLCPSAAALRALLAEVVAGGQRGLHRRVVEQVAGTSPHQSQRPTTASPSTKAAGGSTKGNREADVSGSGGSEGPEDAIEAALQLLLRYARQAQAGVLGADRTSARGRAPQSGVSSPTPASSAPLTETTGLQPSAVHGRLQAADPIDVCDVDMYSNDLEEQAQDAEEDVFEKSQILQQQRAAAAVGEVPGSGTASPTAQTPSATGAASEQASMWLRVPGILPLGQYCAELPWVADLAAQRYTEACERKKHCSGGAGEVGYISRHLQPGEQGSGESVEGKEVRYEAGYIAPTPAALQMMPPLGYLFAPTLACGSVGSVCSGGESVVGRAMRHAAGGPADAPHAAPADFREEREGATSAQEEERSWMARVVVKCVSAAVDAAWQDVEETVVAPFCAQRRRAFSSWSLSAETTLAAVPVGASAGGGEAADEEEVITQFMEVLRVRYAVELAAQVLAARHATELLLDSEDSVIFAERRLVAVVVGGGSFSAGACSEGHDAVAAKRASPSPAPVLTCTVLSLPGVTEIFYVMAYCTGAALLSDVTAAISISGYDVGNRQGGADALQRQECLILDLDAEEDEEEDQLEERPLVEHDSRLTGDPRRIFSPSASQRAGLANEEDPVAQRQASLQAWAAFFEDEYLRGCQSTTASADVPWSAGRASMYSSWSLAPYYRLWLYLWEYVLVVAAPTSSSTDALHSSGAAERDCFIAQCSHSSQRSSKHPRGQRQPYRHGGASLAQIPVSLRTARRWMEKVIRASMMYGCTEAGLLVSCATPASLVYEPETCLQTHLSVEQTERLMKATALQARRALLQVSGAGGAAVKSPPH
ncbi:hypothetical protein, conserved [Leishmania lindenbergi]|uniref:Uncharacterized protein n=1 Tax=Leishmania lindenbergi TaxID=651832 RepID=A0AAW3ADL1_9TRYP